MILFISRIKLTAERGKDSMKEKQTTEKQKSRATLTIERGQEAQKKYDAQQTEKRRSRLRVEKGPKFLKDTMNAYKLKSRRSTRRVCGTTKVRVAATPNVSSAKPRAPSL